MVEERIIIGNLNSLSDEVGYLNVRVDRASSLGNPFYLANEKDRDAVCDAYKEWLLENIREGIRGNKEIPISLLKWQQQGLTIAKKFKNPTPTEVVRTIKYIFSLIKQGKNIRLLCWCFPSRCHSEGIKEVLEEMLRAHDCLELISKFDINSKKTNATMPSKLG